jgi:hypothetical protein
VAAVFQTPNLVFILFNDHDWLASLRVPHGHRMAPSTLAFMFIFQKKKREKGKGMPAKLDTL